jgi:hypothetical protein
MFGNENVTVQILKFIAALDFKAVKGGTRIQVFEVTIRHLAAMVSAWDLLMNPFSYMANDTELRHALYTQMTRLGDVLSCAFDSSSGIPHEWIDPTTCQSDQGVRNTVAGAGTMILEFARLSDITGNQTYASLAQRAEQYLLEPQPASGEPFPGLLGSFISVETGEILDSQGSWGAFADCEIQDITIWGSSGLISRSLLRISAQSIYVQQRSIRILFGSMAHRSRFDNTLDRVPSLWTPRMDLATVLGRSKSPKLNGVAGLVRWWELYSRRNDHR